MKEWLIKTLIKLGLKFVSYDALVGVIASAISYTIEYARTHASQDGWDKAKAGMKQVKNWLEMFDEIYEDDTLTPEEEKKIQDAIANCTTTTSIYNFLQNRDAKKGE